MAQTLWVPDPASTYGRVVVVKLVHAMKLPLIVGPLGLPEAVSDTSAGAKRVAAAGSLIFNERRHAGNCGTGSPCLLVCPEEKLAMSGGVGSFFGVAGRHRRPIRERLNVRVRDEDLTPPEQTTQPSGPQMLLI